MAKWLADRIIKGKMTFLEVPAKLKESVRKILIEKGREDLINDGE